MAGLMRDKDTREGILGEGQSISQLDWSLVMRRGVPKANVRHSMMKKTLVLSFVRKKNNIPRASPTGLCPSLKTSPHDEDQNSSWSLTGASEKSLREMALRRWEKNQ